MRRLLESYKLMIALALVSLIVACGEDDDDTPAPAEENAEEVITDITLTFTPDDGGAPIIAIAQDPDGDGPQDLQVTQNISLIENTSYTLAIELLNAENPNDIEDITEEVNEEAEEHMFFFEWNDGIFSDPTGNGNVDNRSDVVNYNDQDSNGLPLGLSTSWTTSAGGTGSFRLILKHQPDGIKSASSSAEDGESDVDVSWTIIVQ